MLLLHPCSGCRSESILTPCSLAHLFLLGPFNHIHPQSIALMSCRCSRKEWCSSWSRSRPLQPQAKSACSRCSRSCCRAAAMATPSRRPCQGTSACCSRQNGLIASIICRLVVVSHYCPRHKEAWMSLDAITQPSMQKTSVSTCSMAHQVQMALQRSNMLLL